MIWKDDKMEKKTQLGIDEYVWCIQEWGYQPWLMFHDWYVEEYKSCHQKGQHWLGYILVTPMSLGYLLWSCQDLVTCKLDCIYIPEEIFRSSQYLCPNNQCSDQHCIKYDIRFTMKLNARLNEPVCLGVKEDYSVTWANNTFISLDFITTKITPLTHPGYLQASEYHNYPPQHSEHMHQ